MVDETDQGGISNEGTNPTPAATPASVPEPDVRIIEETIIPAAPKSTPVEPKVNLPAAIQQPVPQPPSVPPPAPAPPPSAPPVTPQTQDPQTNDDGIAEILKKVKLPERREERGAADIVVPPPTPAPETQRPAVTGAMPPAITPREAERKTETVVPVHTLRDDLQGVVRDTKMSVVRAVSLEEDRRTHNKTGDAAETPATAQRSKRTVGIMFAVLLFFAIGAAALFGVFTVMQEQRSSVPPIPSTSILFSEQSVLFALSDHSPNDLKRTLAAARTSSAGTLGSITRIIPVITATDPDGTTQDRPATSAEFIRALGAHAPDDLLRALHSDFFFGIHTVDENAPLLVIPINSYDHAFAGMLAWEEVLNTDLAPAFTAVPSLKTDQNGIPARRTFQDLVMRNYDVRALKDDAGEIQLYYSFPSQKLLVIAESPYSFTEILSRLQAGRRL